MYIYVYLARRADDIDVEKLCIRQPIAYARPPSRPYFPGELGRDALLSDALHQILDLPPGGRKGANRTTSSHEGFVIASERTLTSFRNANIALREVRDEPALRPRTGVR